MKKIFISLCFLVLGLCLPAVTFAEEDASMPDIYMPGQIEGTGTHFEITDSEYLNITLDSAALIKLSLESAPEMVNMNIETASGATATQITLGGFQPSTTYYKYEDNYHNLTEFTADMAGRYNYTQDISIPHVVFIQPGKSTKFIKDDATGGGCTSIGIWDWATKTCTLTTDLNETIQIDNDYITLDGNGHTITGVNYGSGIHIPYRGSGYSTGITVKNINVRNFSSGIMCIRSNNTSLTNNNFSNNRMYGMFLNSSSNNTLTGNIASNTTYRGIRFSSFYGGNSNNTLTGNTASNNGIAGIIMGEYGNSNNILTGNTASNNGSGISNGIGILISGTNNTLTGNTASNNGSAGIAITGYDSTYNTITDNIIQENGSSDLSYYFINPDNCDNAVIQNNTGSGGRPIKYFHNAPVNLQDEVLAGLILCNADYSNIENVTIKGSETLKNNWLRASYTDNSTFTNINSSDNYYGVSISGSNNTITGVTASNNYSSGISLSGSYSTITGNIASNNGSNQLGSSWGPPYGISIGGSDNTITGNTASNNYGSGFQISGYYNTITNNTVSYTTGDRNNQSYGFLIGAYDSALSGNISAHNTVGLYLSTGKNNTFSDNTISYNSYGIYALCGGYPYCDVINGNHQFYNNNFIANSEQFAYQDYRYDQYIIFNLAAPIGGNYWSNFDAPEEGCADADNDGFCDAPFSLTSGLTDNLPWTIQDGWKTPADAIAPSTTAAVSGTGGDNGWYTSDVTVTLTAADNGGGSGVNKTEYSFDGAIWYTYSSPIIISAECSPTTIYYKSTDNAGNVETAKNLSVKIDKTPPSTTADVSGTPGNNGWYVSAVTVTLAATDACSGVKEIHYTINGVEYIVTGNSAVILLGEDGTYEIKYWAVDNAGGVGNKVTTPVNREATPPVTASSSPAGTSGGNGYYTSCVSVTLSSTSASGIDKIEYRLADDQPWQTYTSGGVSICSDGTTTITYRGVSSAGNMEEPKTLTVKIDRTPPVITITGAVDNEEYTLCSAPAPVYTVADATSGVDTSTIIVTTEGGNENGMGTFTYTVSASDLAGNTATKTVTYKVTYSFDGFQQPVTLGKPFKLGSTIPVKFILTDGCGNTVSTAAATLTLQLTSGGVPEGDPLDASSLVPDSGNVFRYDSADNQYIYNLSTDNLYAGTWKIIVTLDDGTEKTTEISIKD